MACLNKKIWILSAATTLLYGAASGAYDAGLLNNPGSNSGNAFPENDAFCALAMETSRLTMHEIARLNMENVRLNEENALLREENIGLKARLFIKNEFAGRKSISTTENAEMRDHTMRLEQEIETMQSRAHSHSMKNVSDRMSEQKTKHAPSRQPPPSSSFRALEMLQNRIKKLESEIVQLKLQQIQPFTPEITPEMGLRNLQRRENVILKRGHSENPYLCKICNVPLSGELQIQSHLAGKKHKAMIVKLWDG